MSRSIKSERGAILIHVAVALVGLIAFTAFVVDYGVMWVSRGQAQTAADAGALSGAVALAFDSPTDFAGAQEKARVVAQSNAVFGRSPDVQPTDITFPPCPPGAPGLPDTCVKVDAYRNADRGNPLPIFFGQLVGVASQGVVATATAQVVTGDSTDCLKPWAVVDRWQEYGPEGYLPTSTYDRYSTGQGQAPPPEADLYVPPGGANGSGTGFRLPDDEGARFAVKTEGTEISSGWFREILLPRADGHWTGGDVYRENIETCGGLPYSIAQPGVACPADIGQDTAAYWAARGCFGVKTGGTTGPTRQGVEVLIGRDPGAAYNAGSRQITGSAFSPATRSPRVVPIGVMDVDDFLSRNPTGATGVVRLVNIFGFFIEGMGDVETDGSMTLRASGKAVIGRIVTIPSLASGTSPLPESASFLRTIILVR